MPAHFTERLIQSIAAWVYVVTFFYDGEPFDYMYDAGSIMGSEGAARACIKRRNYKHEAQKQFLEDVHLETQH